MIDEARLATIESRLAEVRDRIAAAAARAGRGPDDVELLPITKGHPVETVQALFDLGFRRVGENRVEEARAKQRALAGVGGLHWDMVGHIQSRKAGEAAANFDRVHSVDRMKIARYLDKNAAESGKRLPVFLECNVTGEESKYGFDLQSRDRWPARVNEFKTILDRPHLQVVGLMTMAPWTDDERVLRRTFRSLRELRDLLRDQLPEGDWRHLSMGMTDDFEIAIEEGATVVRLGRAILGARR